MEFEKCSGSQPEEVVEIYRQGCVGEVVEVYARPLPPGMMPPPLPEETVDLPGLLRPGGRADRSGGFVARAGRAAG